jgi:hypothetical protein
MDNEIINENENGCQKCKQKSNSNFIKSNLVMTISGTITLFFFVFGLIKFVKFLISLF